MTTSTESASPAPVAAAPGVPAAAPVSVPAVVVPVAKPPMTYVQKVLVAVGVSLAAVLLAVFVFYVIDIVVLCFAGLLLAIFLSAPSDLLAKYARIKRAYALLIVLVGLVLLVGGGGYFMGYTVYRQSRELGRTLPGALAQFEADLEHRFPRTLDAPATLPDTLPAVTGPAATGASTQVAHEDSPRGWLAEKLIGMRAAVTDFFLSESFVKRAGGVAGGVVSSTFGIIGNIAVVFGVGLFFAINPGMYSRGLVMLFPRSRRARTAVILSEVGSQLQWWFVGQLCSMVSIGVLTFVGLTILRVPMAVTLGILAGLMNFIPNFGPILAAAPAVLVAFAPHGDQTALNPALAGWVIVLYVMIQLAEGWIITPFFQQRAVELPPALIILSQVLFGLLLGPIGLVLATPILATLIVLVRMVYVEDVLGGKS